MKYYELDQEEKNILHDYEDDTLKYVKGFAAEKKLYQSYAKATLGKTKNINIRISDKDLMKIKAKAAAVKLKVSVP